MAQLIIGVGGTGKKVILFYRRLTQLLGNEQRTLIFDLPFGKEDTDKELAAEGFGRENFLEFLPIDRTLDNTLKFGEFMGFEESNELQIAARVLYTSAQMSTQLARGMNCEPLVGASAATKKLADLTDVHIKILEAAVANIEEVILVGSITGGTGSGGIPVLAAWLKQRKHKDVYGLLYLPWLNIRDTAGSVGPSNHLMRRNVHSVLSFLQQRDSALNRRVSGESIFRSYVLIGPTRDEERTDTGSSTKLVNPLHLVGAFYLLNFEALKTVRPSGEDLGPQFLEIHSNRLSPEKIRSGSVTLRIAVMRRRVLIGLLRVIAKNQHPDQALSPATLFPSSLAWDALVDTVRNVVLRSASWGREGRIWRNISRAIENAANEEELRINSLESLTKLEGAQRVFNISWEKLRHDADANRDRCLMRLQKDIEPVDPAYGKSEDDAVRFVATAIVKQVTKAVSEEIKDTATQKS